MTLEDTYYHLKGQNDNKELYSYETHAPMVFNKHKLLKIIKKKPIYSNGRNERVHRNKHVGGNETVLTADELGNPIEKKKNGRCKYCGASQKEYERDESLESHAYAFIHTDNIKTRVDEIFGGEMKFDVIIGNPPYQLSDGGNNASSKPIYHLFIEQAKKLEPRFLSVVVPARWYAGGKGLDEFRASTLSDPRLQYLHDFFDTNDVFPGVDISGGVCYFLWSKDYKGMCEVTSHISSRKSTLIRNLIEGETGTFVRFNEAIPILRKIKNAGERSFGNGISSRKPFGIPTNIKVSDKLSDESVKIYAYPKNGFVPKNAIEKNEDWIARYKVLSAKAYGERGAFPYKVVATPSIAEPGSCCSETYICLSVVDSQKEAKNIVSYIATKFFRFLVLLKKNTQDATSKVYEFVPTQDFTKPWTDEELYKKYGLDEDEIGFIERMIRPMEVEQIVGLLLNQEKETK